MATAPFYRGRLAPSPTGYLHRGHAATFLTAARRAVEHQGTLVLRVEDLDRARCKPEYRAALLEDLRWLGLEWQEGPEVGGPCAPYVQSERGSHYLAAWQQLASAGMIYPCNCSRRDVARAIHAPHADEREANYPGTCRPAVAAPVMASRPGATNWRFRTSPDETVSFHDHCAGQQSWQVGRDFGDFLVWRRDGMPAYQLAVAVDDAAMQITEVVRGADLLASTAQQLLIYRALGHQAPAFYHCPLVTDANGVRLAKRAGAHSLRAMRAEGWHPADVWSEALERNERVLSSNVN